MYLDGVLEADLTAAAALINERRHQFQMPDAIDRLAIKRMNELMALQPRCDATIDELPLLADLAPDDEIAVYRPNGSGGGVTYKTLVSLLTGNASLELGPFIEDFLPANANPDSPSFDWGPIVTSAAMSVGSNTIIQFRSFNYTFATPGIMSGAGVSLIGANQGASIFTALGNNDIIGESDSWNNSYVANITFQCRQDGVHPTAGASLNLSGAAGIHVTECVFSGTWYGVFAQGCKDLHLRDCAAKNFRKAGYWFAQAQGQGAIIQLNNCGANPANVSGGAALDATGYVFDGNLASITVSGFGGTGNSNDAVSYGDLMRFQNSFGGQAATLVEIYNGTADHWPNFGFNFGNWTGPANGAVGVSPGAGAGAIAKLTASNLISTSAATGLFLDGIGGFQAVNLDMSDNGRGYGLGANASDVVGTGWKTNIAGAVGFGIEPGFQGLMLSNCQVGKLGTTATGAALKFDQPASPTAMSNDNIYIHDCPLHATVPVSVGAASTFAQFMGPNTEILDCDGFNPLLGAMATPPATDPFAGGFPATTVDVINSNPFPIEVSGNIDASFTYTITPQGIGPMDAPYTSPTMVAGNFNLRVPTWGKLHFTYSATPTRVASAAGY